MELADSVRSGRKSCGNGADRAAFDDCDYGYQPEVLYQWL